MMSEHSPTASMGSDAIPLIPLSRTSAKKHTTSTHQERTIRLNNPNAPLHKYPSNKTRNQKYSVVTIVPIVLWHQFKFFMNLYFLLISLSQFIKVLIDCLIVDRYTLQGHF
jgi:phospholipid-translocating ATPase